jgi:uncharacterized tellurite resistance protein B-like protein
LHAVTNTTDHIVIDKLLHRKINLLIHLAHVDGKFDESEKELLRGILIENGLHAVYLEDHRAMGVDLKAIAEIPGKTELLYWVLKLIHADGQLHPAELEYSRVVARQLGFREEVIEQYSTNPIKTLVDFERDVKNFEIPHSK